MRYEETIQECYDKFPSLFVSRWQVLNQFFCVIGNGYEWINGELVAMKYGDEEEDPNYYPELDENGRAHQPKKRLFIELEKWYAEIYKNAGIEMPVYSPHIKEMLESKGIKIETTSDRIIADVAKHINDASDENIDLYPLSEYSAIFNIPENIKSDWMEGIKEIVRLLLIHGHGGEKVDMNEWQEEQHSIWTKELHELANKLGVSTINLNK